MTYYDIDLATVGNIFDGVINEVGNNLIEVVAVYPHFHVISLIGKGQFQLSLVYLIIVIVTDVADEFTQWCLGKAHSHLTFFYLADAQYLVSQRQQTVGVTLNVTQCPDRR